MTLESYSISRVITLNVDSCVNTNQFLSRFDSFSSENIFSGEPLDFELSGRLNNNKVPPILDLAKPEEAKELTKIYQDLYYGTYPYREMNNELEVKKMIMDPSIQWVTFKNPNGSIVGCVTFVLDFFHKRGYIRGFMLKKKYQGYIDIIKAMIGSMIGMCCTFKNKILLWYVENRTAHTSSQYPMYRCGLEPIGFYPNKDIFFGKVESDLMQIAYDKKALKILRSRENPQIIPEAINCFNYSAERYNLGTAKIKTPKLKLNKEDIKMYQRKLNKKITRDKFGYYDIKLYFTGTKSYFKFLYTSQVGNFEKTEYYVNNLEELFVFVQEFNRLAKLLKVRYYEAFISAYEAEHQTIFYKAGLRPRGYIPSWNYDQKKNVFEDCILFNEFEGRVDSNIQLISKGKELLNCLNLI